MVVVRIDGRLLGRLVGVAVLLAAGWWLIDAGRADAQEPAEQVLPTVAIVARADNPVDALAASAVAGQLGAPVFLTAPDALGEDSRAALVAADPDLVVLAGGLAALSEAVEQQVAGALPEADVRRLAGEGRTQTAVAMNGLAADLGFDRPVLAGASVAGDVGIDGTLTLDGVDVAAALAAQDARIAALTGDLAAALDRIGQVEDDAAADRERIAALEVDLAAATGRVAALEATLDGVARDGDLLTFSGMNVAVVNGAGTTATTNGLGNLILGYNEDFTTPDDQGGFPGDGTADVRTGSHTLVAGVDHTYSSFGGIVVGRDNETAGIFSAVAGGASNRATGDAASVAGGQFNVASGQFSSVAGGLLNGAVGLQSSVAGGAANSAAAQAAAVAGGQGNVASGVVASVAGGFGNTSSGFSTAVAGGSDGAVADSRDSLIGNTAFTDA